MSPTQTTSARRENSNQPSSGDGMGWAAFALVCGVGYALLVYGLADGFTSSGNGTTTLTSNQLEAAAAKPDENAPRGDRTNRLQNNQLEAAVVNLVEIVMRAGHESGVKRAFAGEAATMEQEADVAAMKARIHYEDLMPRNGLTTRQRTDGLAAISVAYGIAYATALKGQSYEFMRDSLLQGITAGVLEVMRR